MDRGTLCESTNKWIKEDMISVLYNTIRPGGFDILKNTLDKQTERDFEVIIVDGWNGDRKDEVLDYLKDYKVTYLKGLPKKEKDVWTLNKDYNQGLEACSGELILFLQDYLWIPHDGFEKMLSAYADNPTAFVTSHGHKAMYPNTAEQMNGKISIWDKPFISKPTGMSEAEGRDVKGHGYEEVDYSAWEMNFASAPKAIMDKIGGFEEDMDEYYSGDNVVVAAKAEMAGATFIMDKDLKIVGFNQDAFFPRPKMWNEWHSNRGYLQQKTCQIFNQEQ
jgi:glycosyltransferase involved in cell wall biosynthesis